MSLSNDSKSMFFLLYVLYFDVLSMFLFVRNTLGIDCKRMVSHLCEFSDVSPSDSCLKAFGQRLQGYGFSSVCIRI